MDNNPAFDSIRLLAQNRRAVFIGIVVGSISYGVWRPGSRWSTVNQKHLFHIL